ncbi:putative P-type H(+)-exporting transporter [Helianthus debilis subsp. tardiflorus]
MVVCVLSNGKWNEEDAYLETSIKLGDIIPVDARLLQGDPLKIDQSALTGESLLVNKNPGDGVYSGSTCIQGEFEAFVIATGVHTFFRKAAHLVDTTKHISRSISAVVLMDARASRLENQDAIDTAKVSMLADPKEILNLAKNKSEIERRVHTVIDNFAEHGLQSLGVAHQEVLANTKDSPGGPWELVGLLPIFDPPRHESTETIERALDMELVSR